MRKINEVFVNDVCLTDILEKHKKWLNCEEGGERVDLSFFDIDLSCVDLRGVNLSGAFLRGVDLRGSDLSFANLRATDLEYANLNKTHLTNTDLSRSHLKGINLSGANLKYCDLAYSALSYADLSNTDLTNSDLTEADLRGANLSNANLKYADLKGANLSYSDLNNANLISADLKYTNLKYANLYSVNLIDADLNKSDLRHANLLNIEYNENTSFFALQCPEEGNFIGYKKAHNRIVKLLITKDSKRSSATTRKCRCSKAKVLSITNIENTKEYKKITSDYDNNFIYKVGEIVEVDDFNEDRWEECSTGIHFFLTRGEAIKYEN